MKGIFGFPVGYLPVKYPGIPLEFMKLNIMHYSPLIDKIASITNKWTGKDLSYAGKAELICSRLHGVECYWLQVFPLPSNVIDRITSICLQFLKGTKYLPVAWRDLGNIHCETLSGLNEFIRIHKRQDNLGVDTKAMGLTLVQENSTNPGYHSHKSPTI